MIKRMLKASADMKKAGSKGLARSLNLYTGGGVFWGARLYLRLLKEYCAPAHFADCACLFPVWPEAQAFFERFLSYSVKSTGDFRLPSVSFLSSFMNITVSFRSLVSRRKLRLDYFSVFSPILPQREDNYRKQCGRYAPEADK